MMCNQHSAITIIKAQTQLQVHSKHCQQFSLPFPVRLTVSAHSSEDEAGCGDGSPVSVTRSHFADINEWTDLSCSALSTHFRLHRGSKEADMIKWSSDKNQDNRDCIAHCSPVLIEDVCWVSALYSAFFKPTIVGITRLLVGCFYASSNVVACAKCVNRPLNSFNV